MSIIYKDFTYMNKTLSEQGLICVDFESGSDVPLGLQRTIIKGETNRYRVKSNHIYATYDDSLEFEIHIMKNINSNNYSQTELAFTKTEIRQITRWLTSTTFPQLFHTIDCDDETLDYCGLFTNIEAFAVGKVVYGFILTFVNDSPFAYSDVITNSFSLNGSLSKVITNDSDLLDDYLYPIIRIKPKENTDFYICNLSDCVVLDAGTINISSSSATLNNFLDKINAFAQFNSYTVEYYYDDDAYVKMWANDTAMRIKLIENDDTEHFCFAYYLSDGSYKIIEGAFSTLKLYSDLDIEINCDLLSIRDSIGRLVHFKNIGLDEEDYIYWLRLLSGNNTLLFYGLNCDVEIEYRELLKVGAT